MHIKKYHLVYQYLTPLLSDPQFPDPVSTSSAQGASPRPLAQIEDNRYQVSQSNRRYIAEREQVA